MKVDASIPAANTLAKEDKACNSIGWPWTIWISPPTTFYLVAVRDGKPVVRLTINCHTDDITNIEKLDGTR